MNYVNNATRIRRELMTRIAGLFFKNDMDQLDRIPVEMAPRRSPAVRCCTFKDRAVLKYRLMALLGHRVEDETDELKSLKAYAKEALQRNSDDEQPILTVIDEACSACVQNNYFVTNACQGCVARPCMLNCPKGAIEMKNGHAEIDPDKCVNCGLCMKNCPYHAIIYMPVPCEEACPVGAISKDENGKEQIDYNSCTFCGKCMRECPFGAIMERSQILDILSLITSEEKSAALIAPAIAGQFSASMGKMITALKNLGFDEVIEVSQGADVTAQKETEELQERLGEGASMMTSSCCPAYTEMVKKHIPELQPFVSDTATPMHYTGQIARTLFPDARTVFIGPCVAKRHEAMMDDTVDYVLSIEELGSIFIAKGIDVQECEESNSDYAGSRSGRAFPASGGVTAAIETAMGENTSVTTALIDGLNKKSIRSLKQAAKKPPAQFLEVMACEGGCIAGPNVISNPKVAARHLNQLLKESREPCLCDADS